MAKYELAALLGKTLTEIDEIPYQELIGWYAFLERRPIGWREDNRAAVIAMSFGGSDKIKPEDLFPSLAALKKKEPKEDKTIANKFFERFGHTLTEKDTWKKHA